MKNEKRLNSKVGILVFLFGGLLATVIAQPLHVLTYNIRYDNPKDSLNAWDNRKEFLIAQLNFYQPDIFGTQ